MYRTNMEATIHRNSYCQRMYSMISLSVVDVRNNLFSIDMGTSLPGMY